MFVTGERQIGFCIFTDLYIFTCGWHGEAKEEGQSVEGKTSTVRVVALYHIYQFDGRAGLTSTKSVNVQYPK